MLKIIKIIDEREMQNQTNKQTKKGDRSYSEMMRDMFLNTNDSNFHQYS